jgi:hypothetical protein
MVVCVIGLIAWGLRGVEDITGEERFVEKGKSLYHSGLLCRKPDSVWSYLHGGFWNESNALQQSIELVSVAGDS